MNHETYSLSSADISFFSPEISKFRYIKKCIDLLHINSFNLFWVFKDRFNKHGCYFDDVNKKKVMTS